MKKIFLLLCMCGCTFLNAQVNIETLRKDYYKLNTDSAACAKLYKQISASGDNSNLILGYKGAITASMANHVASKTEKLKLFNTGKRLIEQSIAADSANAELRFLRFTIQSNCPKALGYYHQAGADKKYILSHLNTLKDAGLKNKISAYLINSTYLTEEEKKKADAKK